MKILSQLIEIRKEKKITQIEVAGNINLSVQALRNYEQNKRHISADKLNEYAEYLGYEIRLLKK